MARNVAGGVGDGDGSGSAPATGTGSASVPGAPASRRSENLQRLIDNADQSLNFLASLEDWHQSTTTTGTVSSTRAPASTASNLSLGRTEPPPMSTESFDFTTPPVSMADGETGRRGFLQALGGRVDVSDLQNGDEDELRVVDLAVESGRLHVKGVFPDHSVEYVDMDPRFTTIGDLKRALCEKRRAERDLGLTAATARIMFHGQLVEDDWLVIDCGLGVDGIIHVVQALPTVLPPRISGTGRGTNVDPRLAVPSIASSYAQCKPPLSATGGGDDEAAAMAVEFSQSLALTSVAQSSQLSHKVRPEEVEFAEMISDFYQNLDHVQDTDGYGERLLRGYIDVLQSRLEALEGSATGASRLPLEQRQRLQESIKELRDERNTWRLLYELRRICHPTSGESDELMEITGSNDPDDLRFDMVEDDAIRLLETHNEGFKVQKAVKAWLETMAMEKTVTLSDKRSSVKQGSRTLKLLRKGFVDQTDVRLDPDAVLRDGDRHIVEDDAEDEAELLKCVWSFIRAGSIQDAVDLCIRLGEPWRAASLSGGFHVGANEVDGDRVLDRWGNPMRALWKTTCWKFAEQKGLKLTKRNSILSRQYEEVVYAALSGHVRVLTQSSLCDNWEDHCWAYLQAITEAQIDETLHKLLKVKLQSSKLVVGNNAHYLRLYQALLDKSKHLKRYEVNLDSLFDDLEKSKNERVRSQANEPHRRIQAKLVTARIETIVADILASLVVERDSPDWDLELDEHTAADDITPIFLRFAAHFVLFADFTNEKFDQASSFLIVKAYIRHLVKHGHINLVPIYASQLPESAAVLIYVQILGIIEDRLQRDLCVKRILEYSSMDLLSEVLTRTVEDKSVDLREQAEKNASISGVTSVVDRKRMRLIEYLCFFTNHRAEAIYRANLLAREFVIEGKFAAVKELFVEHVPEDSIGVVDLNRANQTLEDEAIERSTREYLCWKAYNRACNHYDLWRSCSSASGGVEWSSYSEEKDFLTELMYHVSRAASALVDVLHFENGWMLHCSQDADDLSIRRSCLPMLVFNLHFLQLESAKLVLRLRFYPAEAKAQLAQPLLEKSLQVADVVADETYAVSDALTPDHCRDLLSNLRESSIALLHLESELGCDEDDLDEQEYEEHEEHDEQDASHTE